MTMLPEWTWTWFQTLVLVLLFLQLWAIWGLGVYLFTMSKCATSSFKVLCWINDNLEGDK